MKVVFLETDGVVSPLKRPQQWIPVALKHLRLVVRKTKARVVLTSRKRKLSGFVVDVNNRFSSVNMLPLLDTVPHLPPGTGNGMEALKWLQEYGKEVTHWVAFDRSPSTVADMDGHLIVVDGSVGMTAANAASAIQILNADESEDETTSDSSSEDDDESDDDDEDGKEGCQDGGVVKEASGTPSVDADVAGTSVGLQMYIDAPAWDCPQPIAESNPEPTQARVKTAEPIPEEPFVAPILPIVDPEEEPWVMDATPAVEQATRSLEVDAVFVPAVSATKEENAPTAGDDDADLWFEDTTPDPDAAAEPAAKKSKHTHF
eukprot:NODE_4691_length_1030_cov_80.599779_g4487_i0.p1 GENE.NODE_4691_length_1030_cov_80.599779_g4487_i0~~NODE_4691_length_1030_cov_80.599779_g4487_i0.p1  ORF type:complete len:336 (+),score=94.84 NODE_4691_length_1030_cov_80.599779_g4487_i0:58-1008(+)